MREIERKFLVNGNFKSGAVKALKIAQGYICAARGRTVRVRIRGEEGFLTIKGPVVGLTRFEWEKAIPVEEARELMKLCVDGLIQKTRYIVPCNDGRHSWEVDEFHGLNEGLVVAEIELSSEEDTFERPSWLGEEVSGDRRYYNSCLLADPYCNWKDKI